MAIKTREECRTQLGVLLSAGVTSAEVVFDYSKSDTDQKSPAVTISSLGMAGQGDQTFAGQWHPAYRYAIVTFVRDEPATGYTEEDIDDLFDDVAQEIFETLMANDDESGFWQSITWDIPSEVTRMAIGGKAYLVEPIMITVQVYQ